MGRKVRQATPHAAVGKRLMSARRAKGGDNLGRWAEAAGIAPNAYSQNETGARLISLESAIKLKDTYGISLDWIYCGDPSAVDHATIAEHAKLIRKTPG